MRKLDILPALGLSALVACSFTACNDYLDVMPDSRTEITTEDAVAKLVTSAYPDISYMLIAECMSDNTDDLGSNYSNYTDRFLDQVYAWDDITETANDGPRYVWEECYNAVATANQALQSIEEMGGATTQTLSEAKAEALMCRAYNMFVLVNMFCLNYNSQTSSTDRGLPYPTEPETTLFEDYERLSVAEDYEMMAKDIEEALPLLGDTHLDVPKYHFNRQAAYAFAARFYLFYEKWEEAASCATEALGSSPSSVLRDWDEMESYGITSDLSPRTNLYIDSGESCNFLLITAISYMPLWQSNYVYWTKYAHDTYISNNETLDATHVYGSSSLVRCGSLIFSGGSMNRALVAKIPYLFEYTDQANEIGYLRTVYVPFRGDITLLERAEAYTMMGEYDLACADLTMWMQNWTTSTRTLTPDYVTSFYNSVDYYTWDVPTVKKHLNPAFTIDAEGSTQECMLQCVLDFKRIETIHEGLRWFDIKRYGMTIYRRTMDAAGEPSEVTDSLLPSDLRRAIQLPTMVLQAGMEANPR